MNKYIISVDLGGTNLRLALLDSKFKIKNKKILSTHKYIRKEDLIQAIIDSVEEIIKVNSLKKREILGVGLGLPGPIDTSRGIVHFFPNIPGWKRVRLKSILERKLGLSIFLDNDANLMCLAEFKLGAAKNFNNVLCLTLGTGVGGGIIIERKLYRGSSFAAGEIGHVPINLNGPHCNCGGIACLETYIGNNRILAEARRVYKRDISLEELSSLAKKQDKKAVALWVRVGRCLGTALVGAVNLLNPDAVVIGGGVSNAGRVLFDKVKDVISKQAIDVQAEHVKVFKAKLGIDAGLIGAAILVREERGY